MRLASFLTSTLVAITTLLLITSAAASGPVSIHNFARNLFGCEPSALLIDPSGNLFGLAGDPNADPNCGTIFELQAQSNGSWKYLTLHQDSTLSQQTAFARDANGNLFAATVSNLYDNPQSAIVELSPLSGGKWSYQTIYTFGADDGSLPSWLLVDASGNLYGTTTLGGSGGGGIVFKLSPNTSGPWTETVLYSFPNGAYSGEPDGLVMDASGNLFGTTYFSGECRVGSVFELQPAANGWTYSLLHSFCVSDGNAPEGGLVIDKAGNLYGADTEGGPGCDMVGCGLVFELSPGSGGKWIPSTLVNFGQQGLSGSFPFALTMDSKGNLFGVTGAGGGTGYFGTMFELTQSDGQWNGRTIYRFPTNPVANIPCCNLIVTPSETILGATNGASGNAEWGTVFEWTLP